MVIAAFFCWIFSALTIILLGIILFQIFFIGFLRNKKLIRNLIFIVIFISWSIFTYTFAYMGYLELYNGDYPAGYGGFFNFYDMDYYEGFLLALMNLLFFSIECTIAFGTYKLYRRVIEAINRQNPQHIPNNNFNIYHQTHQPNYLLEGVPGKIISNVNLVVTLISIVLTLISFFFNRS
jgi:hypothetical protein